LRLELLLHTVIKGKVQGVGFRHFTKTTADKLGIKGWVRNNPDGSVEVIAEGDEKILKEFLDYLKKGPSLSVVTDVKYEFLNKEGGFENFEIRY
jgi:acylphosphatase